MKIKPLKSLQWLAFFEATLLVATTAVSQVTSVITSEETAGNLTLSMVLVLLGFIFKLQDKRLNKILNCGNIAARF